MNFFMKTENLVESDFVQFDISYDNIRVTKKFLIPKFDCTMMFGHELYEILNFSQTFH